MNILQLLQALINAGVFGRIANNPLAQFGVGPQNLLGASILPERLVDNNFVDEANVRYRTVVANDGTHYSPVQIRSAGALFGSFAAKLADSDTGAEYTGQDYDALRRMLGTGGQMQAQANVVQWVERLLNQPLVVKNEVYRWQAIHGAQVIRTGDNGFREIVNYPNPDGHRVDLAASWSAKDENGFSTVDPFEDLFAIQASAESKGYALSRFISTRTVVNILRDNTHVKTRAGGVVTVVNGREYQGGVGLPQINSALFAAGLPAIEQYDERYYTQTGAYRFIPEDCLIALASTGQSEQIAPEVGDPFYVNDTLGYLANGITSGSDSPGRQILVSAFSNKPPRLEGESWQTTLPVIIDPETIWVIDNIS